MRLNLLDKYIAKTVLSAIALVTFMLIGLQIFILFVNQIDDLGKVNYGIVESAIFVLLQTPYQVYLFFPMASLLGSLIGLGLLANNRELIVMRAAGLSIGKVTQAVLKGAMIVIVLATLLGETLAPKLAEYANNRKSLTLNENVSFGSKGLWLRYKNNFINVTRILPDDILKNVSQFQFDENHNLVFARSIETLSWKNGNWVASDVLESYIQDDKVTNKQIAKQNWNIKIKPEIFRDSINEPDEMTLVQLHQFLHDQKKFQKTPLNYHIAYWQRLVQPFTTAVMMILAIPFIFGPLRSSTMGSKLLAGATIGFSFHILNRVFGTISQVLQWPPIVAGLGPTFLFAFFGLYIMRKAK